MTGGSAWRTAAAKVSSEPVWAGMSKGLPASQAPYQAGWMVVVQTSCLPIQSVQCQKLSARLTLGGPCLAHTGAGRESQSLGQQGNITVGMFWGQAQT